MKKAVERGIQCDVIKYWTKIKEEKKKTKKNEQKKMERVKNKT